MQELNLGASISATPRARDPHRFINDLDETAVQRLVDRLESRAKDPVFMAPFHRYAQRLPLDSASRVLEVGSGTGAICRALSARPEFSGAITGVDQSAVMVNCATTLAADAGLAHVIDFRVGDAQDLEFGDDTFDIAIAHTVVSHVADHMVLDDELGRGIATGHGDGRALAGVFHGRPG